MSLVHVIIEGSAHPTPENQASAARALALRYNLPEADALKLLQAGQRFRVRANADPADAAKMVNELRALGLIASAVPASGRPNTPLPPGAPAAGTPPPQPAAAAPPRPPAPPPLPSPPVMPAKAPAPPPARPPAVAKTMMGGMGAPPAGLPPIGPKPATPAAPAAPAAAPAPAAKPAFESGLAAASASAPPPPAQTFGLAAAAAAAPTPARPSPAVAAPPPAPPPTASAESSFDKLGDAGGLMLSALDGTGDEDAGGGGPVDRLAGRSQAEQEAMFRPPDEQEESNQLLLDDIPATSGTVNSAPLPSEPRAPGLPSAGPSGARAATPTATLGPSAAAADLAAFGIEVPAAGSPGQKKKSIDLSAVTGLLREHATGPVPLFFIGIVLALLLGYLPVAGYASGAEEKKFAPVIAEIDDLQAGKLTLSEWKELPAARHQATERMGNAQTRIAVMSVLLWAAIAGGLAFAWTRFVIPPLVERWSRPPGV